MFGSILHSLVFHFNISLTKCAVRIYVACLCIWDWFDRAIWSAQCTHIYFTFIYHLERANET